MHAIHLGCYGELYGRSIPPVVATHLRLGKVDSLFPISHFLNFDAGGRSLFIIHYDITIYLILQCVLKKPWY